MITSLLSELKLFNFNLTALSAYLLWLLMVILSILTFWTCKMDLWLDAQCFWSYKTDHIALKCLGNGLGNMTSALFSSSYKSQKRHSLWLKYLSIETNNALVDSGCSQLLINGSVCCPWSRQERNMIMSAKILQSQRFGSINLCMGIGELIKVIVLIVDKELLGFNMHLGMDIIKKLDRVHITESGKVHFSNIPICAAIRIEKSNFSAELKKKMKKWTALWK